MDPQGQHTAIYIQASLARAWEACTQPDALSVWYSAPCLAFGREVGDPVVFGTPEREVIRGSLQAVTPEQSLTYSFAFQGFGFVETSSVSLRVEAQGPVVLLGVEHDFYGAPQTQALIGPLGWPKLLARLKTWLETGQPMPWPEETPPPSLRT